MSVRAFVAILLPEPVRAALAAEIERLARVARGVTWVRAENLHVTLKFLGHVAPGRLAEVAARLAETAGATAVFDLAVTGLGAFPTPLRPRVLWAGLDEGGAHVAALAARVDEALAPLAFPREERPFTGHVTLGRLREPRRDEALARAIAAGTGRPYGRLRVDRVALMRSDLSPHGARYTVLETWPFG